MSKFKMNTVYIAITDDLNYMAHEGRKGMHWYTWGGPGIRYQNHAVYAKYDKRYARGSKKTQDNKNKSEPKYDASRIAGAIGLPVSSIATFALSAAVGTPAMLAVTTPALAASFGVGALWAKNTISAYVNENKNEKRMKNLPVDEKTGLHLKHQEFSEKEDLSKINPGYNNFRNDTKNNCALCTVAYDMRRRGYDVSANKSLIGYNFKDLKRWYPDAVQGKTVNRYMIDAYNKSRVRSQKDLTSELTKTLVKQGNGARGELAVSYKNGWGGHSMVYEVSDGKVTILDGQTNKRYQSGSNSYNKYFDRCFSFTPTRLDNISFNPDTITEAVH